MSRLLPELRGGCVRMPLVEKEASNGAAYFRMCLAIAFLIAGALPREAVAATFECSIEPRLRLRLAAPIDGVLEEVLVDRGAHVHKGDVVAKLNAEVDEATAALDKAVAENEAEVASWSARVEYLKLQQERASQLQTRGAGTQERLDDANGNLQVAQSGLLNARERRSIASLNYERAIAIVKQKSISSPIDGIVFEHLLGPGEYAYHDRSPIMVIDQLDPLNVEVHLPVNVLRQDPCRDEGHRSS